MFKQIFTGAAAGAALTTGVSYLATPVYAPGVMMWAANMGLISGALGGLGVGCAIGSMNARSGNQREAYGLGMALSMVSFIFMSGFTLVDTLFSIAPDVGDELKEKTIALYGEDFTGAEEGDVVMFDVAVFGDQKEPVIATIKEEPTAKIQTGNGTLQFEVCTTFDVALKNAPEHEIQEHTVCNIRDLTQREIQRIVPTFN